MAEDLVQLDPPAQVSRLAIIGSASSIWHPNQVRGRAQIGRSRILGKGVYEDFNVTNSDNNKLQNSVFVSHPATIDEGVFLGPFVIISNARFLGP